MWNISDKSDEFCERIIQVGLHADMLQNLSSDKLSAATLNDPASGNERDMVEAHSGTLHNVVRRAEAARAALRKCNAVDIVQKLRDVTEYPVISLRVLIHCWKQQRSNK